MLLLNLLADACCKKNNTPTLLLICHLSNNYVFLKEMSVARKLIHVKYNNRLVLSCAILTEAIDQRLCV